MNDSKRDPQRIAVIGAGAIGCWIGTKLAAAGNAVSVLARGESLRAIRTDGLGLVEDGLAHHESVFVTDNPAQIGDQDVVIIAVKATSLADAAEAAAHMLCPSSVILPMVNGVPWWFMGKDTRLHSVDPKGVIDRFLPTNQIIGTVVHGSASLSAHGVSSLKHADKIAIGEVGRAVGDRLGDLGELFATAGIPTVVSADIRKEIWYKLWGNMTINPVSALTLATADQILADECTLNLIFKVMEEARLIGNKIGCPISQSSEDRIEVTRKLGSFKTSMLQDVEAGRAIELEAIVGAPREIGQRLGIETPWIDALYGLTRVFAQSNGLLRGAVA